jgi:hypothetical protein
VSVRERERERERESERERERETAKPVAPHPNTDVRQTRFHGRPSEHDAATWGDENDFSSEKSSHRRRRIRRKDIGGDPIIDDLAVGQPFSEWWWG